MSNILDQAQKIIEANGFTESMLRFAGNVPLNHIVTDCSVYCTVITLVKGKLEDVELPIKEFDIIISEWMGYFLCVHSIVPKVAYCGNAKYSADYTKACWTLYFWPETNIL